MTTQPQDERDAALVRRALFLAELGPEADPNPRVGAVVLDRDGAVVGEGFHRGAGSPHAEVEALARAAGRAREARRTSRSNPATTPAAPDRVRGPWSRPVCA